MSASPLPRFELLKFDRYLHVGVQFGRGCPFMCEFCDIVELFGRVPRLKSAEQMLGELQQLYDLGYRGHIDFVDDNFIGNKRDVKKFLVELREWLEEHRWPFEFSTEASIDLADDEKLLGLMQSVGFDTEQGSVARGVLDLIEASAVPVNMVGLLFALPNTRLQRRLAGENRLHEDFERATKTTDAGDQCLGGLNFETARPRADVLRDYRRIIDECYA